MAENNELEDSVTWDNGTRREASPISFSNSAPVGPARNTLPMHPFVGQIPRVPHEKVQAKRISAKNVAAFLETVPDLIKNTPEQSPDGVGLVWMKEVNLERATLAHREFREKRSAEDLAMLDIVDMGRSFPAPPAQTDVAAACSTQMPPSAGAATAAPTLKITPHASPSTEPSSPSCSTSPSATPATELCAGPAATPVAEGGGEESATCDAVTRSDFIKLLGYDGKKPATPTHPKWWSSPMDPLRRSSLHVSTSSFSQGPANFLGARTRSLPPGLGSPLDVSDGAASSTQQQPSIVLVNTPLTSDNTLSAARDMPSPAPRELTRRELTRELTSRELARAPPSAKRDALLGRLETIVSPTGESPSTSGKRGGRLPTGHVKQRHEVMASRASAVGAHDQWGSDMRLRRVRVSREVGGLSAPPPSQSPPSHSPPSSSRGSYSSGAEASSELDTASDATPPHLSARVGKASGSPPAAASPGKLAHKDKAPTPQLTSPGRLQPSSAPPSWRSPSTQSDAEARASATGESAHSRRQGPVLPLASRAGGAEPVARTPMRMRRGR